MVKKRKINLVKTLSKAVVEKDVENAYKNVLEQSFPGCISSPFGSDGVLRNHVITSTLEFKYDLDLRDSYQQSTVIIQSLYYLKKIEKNGDPLPKTIFIGDINECFVVPVSKVSQYLEYDIDWSIAPSQAAKKNPALVKEIAKNKNIEPFIYDINQNFDFLSVLEKMKNISLDKPYAVPITKHNIVEIFKRFEKDVVKDKYFVTEMVLSQDEDKRISELADLFFTCLTAPKEVFLHPNKKNLMVVRGKEVRVNSKNYRIFFSQFRQEYNPVELEVITANKDRILEDTHRRRTGAFFTPDIWVEEAHKMIAEQFGENWKEEYVVWDCAAGTANLTRGYKFKELYISTIEQSDINTIKDCGYNQEATVFQYDFLGEVGIKKVPEGLKKAFESGEKVLFFINPPYSAANTLDGKFRENRFKNGVSFTSINKIMKKNKMGYASQQVYAQFLYKISLLQKKYKTVYLTNFTPPLFMTGPSYEKFREVFYKQFNFANAMVFQASNFADVKKDWGICFSLWENKKQLKSNKLTVHIKHINNYIIEKIGTKTFYTSGDKISSKWVRKEVKGLETFDSPQMTSAVNIKQEGKGKLANRSLFYLTNVANSVYKSINDVFITSSCSSMAHGLSVVPENFRKAIALFTARVSIIPTWINTTDEYLIPNTEHPDYEQWNNDAIIYTLFHPKSQQSSLRNIDYKDKKWDITNNFFFMSNEEMRELANKHNYKEMYQDTKAFDKDRYVYNLLSGLTVSSDAKKVLDMAINLVKKSMEDREDYNDENPKYQLQCWDASWAQLKPLLKERYKEEYDEFVKTYKEFENRMREGVYKFGFLRE